MYYMWEILFELIWFIVTPNWTILFTKLSNLPLINKKKEKKIKMGVFLSIGNPKPTTPCGAKFPLLPTNQTKQKNFLRSWTTVYSIHSFASLSPPPSSNFEKNMNHHTMSVAGVDINMALPYSYGPSSHKETRKRESRALIEYEQPFRSVLSSCSWIHLQFLIIVKVNSLFISGQSWTFVK